MSAAAPETLSWGGQRLVDDFRAMRNKVPGHVPPIRDQMGFELAVHKSLANKAVDELHQVSIPASWTRPAPYPTRTALRSAREATMRPHVSYDVDGDGFVSAMDYELARKHDQGATGVLSGGHRQSAIAEQCHWMGSKLQDAEIGGNARARRLMTSLREEPEFDNMRREARLRVADSMNRSLKMKSSQQLQRCLCAPPPDPSTPSPRDGPDSPVYTRTMLLERRRIERAATEEAAEQRFLQEYGPRGF